MADSSGQDQICTIRIELPDSEPSIWREIEAPTSITLDDVHEIIQISMAWDDEHLWEFTIGRQKYTCSCGFIPPFGPISDAGTVMLGDVLKPRRTTFDYLYDFGDSWRHRLIVTKIRSPETGLAYPRYVGGERTAPVDDCGGLYRFQEALAAIAEPENGDGEGAPVDWDDHSWWAASFDPDDIDVVEIERELENMAKRLPKRKRPGWKKPVTLGSMGQARDQEEAMADAIGKMSAAFKAATPSRPKQARSKGSATSKKS
jgi:hypothetical protein